MRPHRTIIRDRLLIATAILLLAGAAMAAEVGRSGWVPNVGALAEDELPLGDLWTFRCPPGGSFSASLDTKDDSDQGGARIDPVLIVVSGSGDQVAVADDERACTYEPVCGFDCPSLERVGCGQGASHSIIIRDHGNATDTAARCLGGGGYDLVLEVFDAGGVPLPRGRVRLGGGAEAQTQPSWLRQGGTALQAPRLDDTGVPNQDRFGDPFDVPEK